MQLAIPHIRRLFVATSVLHCSCLCFSIAGEQVEMTDQVLGTLQIMYSKLEYVLKIYTMLLLKTSSSQLSMDSMVS
jgi:hypothetical protein